MSSVVTARGECSLIFSWHISHFLCQVPFLLYLRLVGGLLVKGVCYHNHMGFHILVGVSLCSLSPGSALGVWLSLGHR